MRKKRSCSNPCSNRSLRKTIQRQQWTPRRHFRETTTNVLTSRYTLAKSAEVSLEAAAMCEALVKDALKSNTHIQGPTCPLLPTDL